jgi:hypothetical protein
MRETRSFIGSASLGKLRKYVSADGVEREERRVNKGMRRTRLESEDAEECPVQNETNELLRVQSSRGISISIWLTIGPVLRT